MEERKALGSNVRRYRQFKGLSTVELGDKVGLTKDTILRLERGEGKYTKNIGLDYLIKICNVLDVTIEELFMRNGDLLSLRFVVSEHNIKTLKELITIVCDLIRTESKK